MLKLIHPTYPILISLSNSNFMYFIIADVTDLAEGSNSEIVIRKRTELNKRRREQYNKATEEERSQRNKLRRDRRAKQKINAIECQQVNNGNF